MSSKDKGKDSSAQKKIWDTLLEESKLQNAFRNTNLVILGNKYSGKRTFVNSVHTNILQEQNNNLKVGVKSHTSALEYSFFEVKNPEDPDSDVVAKINVWLMDDPEQKELLSHCITEETVENTIIAIFLDCEEPSGMMQSLTDWMNVISDRLGKILTQLPLNKQDDLRDKLASFVKSYEEPSYDEEGRLRKRQSNKHGEEDEKFYEQRKLPLPPGALTVNYGVPIMIICNKAELLEIYEKEKDGEDKLDFLHYTLRNFGLPYAATLLYTSSKQNLNLDIFYEYLIHRFYGFGFKYKSEPVHRDSIFIPSGYDNSKLIAETFKTIKTDQVFEEVFVSSVNLKNIKEEIVGEDLQSFLARIKDKIPVGNAGKTPSSRQIPGDITPIGNRKEGPASSQNPKTFYETLLTNGTKPPVSKPNEKLPAPKRPTSISVDDEGNSTATTAASTGSITAIKKPESGNPAPTKADPLIAFLAAAKTPKSRTGIAIPADGKNVDQSKSDKLLDFLKNDSKPK